MSGWWKTVALVVLTLSGVGVVVWALLTAVAAIGASDGTDAAAVAPFALSALGGAVIGFMAARGLDHASEWVDALPLKSYLGSVAGFTGAAFGAVAAALTVEYLPVQIAAGAAALAFGFFAVTRVFRLRHEITDTLAERARIAQLRAHGRRVRARVVEVEFSGVWVGAMPLFDVTAEYETRSGVHRVYERLLTALRDAPVADGTVLLWVTADGSNPTDVLMEADADSIRHPDPDQFAVQVYAPPSDA